MSIRLPSRLSLLACALLCASLPAQAAAAQSPPGTGPDAPRTIDARPWPRKYAVDGIAITLFQPQMDSWTGNQLSARIAMSARAQADAETGQAEGKEQFGVLWVSGRTEVDKQAREVTLDNVVVERATFPTAPASEAQYLSVARKLAPRTAQVLSLDHLEAQLAMTQAEAKLASLPVKNDPPEILFAYEPALLVLIDGAPAIKPTRYPGIDRVVNSRSLVARYQGKYYLSYGGAWAIADAIAGPWKRLPRAPDDLQAALDQAVASKKVQVPEQLPENVQALLDQGRFPQVYVRTAAAELLQFEGEPGFDPIDGTTLYYAINTPADVFLDGAQGNAWYVLASGRWFRAASPKGPWTWVDPAKLPADFARIPPDHPKSAVLASIPGTPEAKEALIANSVPQTASVAIGSAMFKAEYDGAPEFRPIEGTTLSYAWNSAAPVIQATPGSFYALQNGVWFLAGTPTGPWQVAKAVPAEIYAIPPASPLHFVTYVQVYGASDDTVYVGYTPGYYGTVVSNGVVVYGTGYGCEPWIGTYWYGCPWTYGFGAAFGWTSASGWGFALGWGWYDPWYGPWWGPWWGYPGYYPGYGWGAAVGNVYGRWGNSVVAGTAAAWANPWTGNYGGGFRGGFYNPETGARGYGRAARNTNLYTGTSRAAAGGIAYNPETGRVAAGRAGSISNIYTGEGVGAARGTVVNSNTGRVTSGGAVAGVGDDGAGVAGGFRSSGAAGDISGIGYVHGDGEGNLSGAGAINVNGDIYAGRDGNVYHRTEDGSWESVDGARGNLDGDTRRDLDSSQMARDRGTERDRYGGRDYDGGNRGSFDRGAYGGGYRGGMGGARPMGGGGFRGGGGRRR